MSRAAAPRELGRFRAVDLDNSGQPIPLGSGAFASVWRYLDTTTGEHVAIKRMRLTGLKPYHIPLVQNYLGSELLNHHMMRHPHVVKLKDVFLTENNLNIVLELAAGGTLFALVNKRVSSKGYMDEEEARWFLQQLIMTMDYFHQKGVAHRDIKLENTLLQASPNIAKPLIKVADFGLSKYDSATAYTRVGTSCYMSPEVVLAAPVGAPRGNGYDPKKADIWSAGVMLLTMLTGRYPFDTNSDVERLRLMTKRPLQLPAHISAECKSLLERLLHPNPEERLGIDQIKREPWFLHGLPPGAMDMTTTYLNAASPCMQTKEQLEGIVAQALQIMQSSN